MELAGNVEEILDFLASREGKLDAVVISGGEPCMQPDLDDFLAAVQALGYAVKLDTNGSYPDVLQSLIQAGLVDYIAMDIKGPLERYSDIAGVEVDASAITRSIGIIEASGLPYLFRTTMAAPLVGTEDIPRIRALIQNQEKLLLQACRTKDVLDPSRISENQYTEEDLAVFAGSGGDAGV